MQSQDTWTSLPASVLLHSLTTRTDQGFLKDIIAPSILFKTFTTSVSLWFMKKLLCATFTVIDCHFKNFYFIPRYKMIKIYNMFVGTKRTFFISLLLAASNCSNFLVLKRRLASPMYAASSGVRRIFERGGRKFENNEDHKKGLYSDVAHVSAQIWVKTKKKVFTQI